MSLIELQNISKTYYLGGQLSVGALRGISLTIESGEFVVIMGHSGSGKSTLLALLGLLDKADAGGQYRLFGQEITRLTENDYASLRNRFFGFVFQMFNLLPKLNVTENALLPFIYKDKVLPEDRDRVRDILKKIGLADRLRHKSNELSGGQQQRVAIARAVANQPLVVLADEPTGNLDSQSAAEIIDLLKNINAQGNTVIMVTHEPDLAAIASRIITLRDGQVIADEKKRLVAVAVSKPREFSLKAKSRRKFFSFARLKNYCFEALLSLVFNKLRSFLSILGVLIGVAAVITMLALGTGAKKSLEKSLSSLGTNLMMVRTSFHQGGISLGTDSVTRFTFEDLKALQKIDSVDKVVPYVTQKVQAVYQNKNWSTQVLGTSSDYQAIHDAVPAAGRFFTDTEMVGRAKVAILGKTVTQELFGNEDPLGKSLRLNRVGFTVIGVLPEKGVSGFRNQDDQILVPVTTAMYRLAGRDFINYFEVQTTDQNSMNQVQEDIVASLLKVHRLAETQTDQFEVRNMAEIQKAAGEMIGTLSFLLGGIAAVSLLVGGIGIMNIMLVIVMERTHEIGLRKALGAENLDIMVQFMAESVLVCFLGGILGILFGVLVSFILASLAGWNTIITFGSILLAFLFSLVIGLVFGIWPARRAARMMPIEALRYEKNRRILLV